jgi:hypothetical protein
MVLGVTKELTLRKDKPTRALLKSDMGLWDEAADGWNG